MAKKTGGTLHHWFKGSKSKDGKPGWVQADGSPCANEPGETKTPKCFSSGRLRRLKKSKRGKSIIRSAVLRKRREDKGQQQKAGASSPTYVKTFAKGKKDPLYVKAEPGIKESMELQEAAKDRPGKGSGKKDACYHKVKSRVKVWPSAYASGMLVQCRKKGAANWGTHSEENVNEEKKYCHICMKKRVKCKCSQLEERFLVKARKRDNIANAILSIAFAANAAQSPKDLIRSGHIEAPNIMSMERMMRKRKKATVSGLDNARVSHPARNKKIDEEFDLEEGRVGWKSTAHPLKSGCNLDEKNKAKMKSLESDVFGPNPNPESVRRYTSLMNEHQTQSERDRMPRGSLSPRHQYRLEKLHGIDVGAARRRGENIQERMLPRTRELAGNARRRTIYRNTNLKSPRKPLQENNKELLMKLIMAALMKAKKRKNYLLNYGYIGEAKTPAWTRNAGKDLVKGGLNRKGIASYRRENPGSKLSMAVTTKPSKLKKGSKSWKRRKSFCARMSGMPGPMKDKKGRPTRKALSLRKWNC